MGGSKNLGLEDLEAGAFLPALGPDPRLQRQMAQGRMQVPALLRRDLGQENRPGATLDQDDAVTAESPAVVQEV